MACSTFCRTYHFLLLVQQSRFEINDHATMIGQLIYYLPTVKSKLNDPPLMHSPFNQSIERSMNVLCKFLSQLYSPEKPYNNKYVINIWLGKSILNLCKIMELVSGGRWRLILVKQISLLSIVNCLYCFGNLQTEQLTSSSPSVIKGKYKVTLLITLLG